MPTHSYVGTTTFREVSINEVHNRTGLDTLTVVRKGRANALAAESALWTKGVSYSGYPNMTLETKSIQDQGPVAEITLNFTGFIASDTPENGLIDKQNDISLSSVSLTSSGGDNVQFSYYGQVTTFRWVHRGVTEPQYPKFPIQVPTDIDVGYLFNPFPARYAGSVTASYRVGARLSGFNVTRLSPHMWAVVESWSVTVEPSS